MPDETVLIAGVSHETNTFAPTTTTRADFRERREYFDEEIVTKLRGTNTAVGGAIDVAETQNVDLIPVVAASATPGGTVERETFEFYRDRIIAGVRDHADHLDGVLLPLHGAMVAEGMDDGEGPLVATVREVVGPAVPIVVTLDLHGNVTDELVSEADALVAYQTYPHVDTGDTGRRGMRLLLRTIRGEVDVRDSKGSDRPQTHLSSA